MMASIIEIKTGDLFKITTDNFLTSGKEPPTKHNRSVKLNKGEIIEIRYPYAWHFRTEDDFYFHATEKMIIDNCAFHGKIDEKIRSKNKAKLEEILRLDLFEPAN